MESLNGRGTEPVGAQRLDDPDIVRLARDDRRHHGVARSRKDWTELFHFEWISQAIAAPERPVHEHIGTTQASDRFVHAGFVRFAVQPNLGRTQFWAAVVRPDSPYVLCRDGDLQLPPQAGLLEVRGGALWTHAICETPLDHWTVAMEAYALAFDDPFEACKSERGDRIGLAFDLEWEQAGAVVDLHADRHPIMHEDVAGHPDPTRHEVLGHELPCVVHGELLIGDDRYDVLAVGHRVRSWGVLPTPLHTSHPAALEAVQAVAPMLEDRVHGEPRQLVRELRVGADPTMATWTERDLTR